MKRITFLLLGLLCSIQSVVYSQMDTIYNRYPSYYYTDWVDSCLEAGVRVSCHYNSVIYGNMNQMRGVYHYTEEPLEIIGIVSAFPPNRMEFTDTNRGPEYYMLYEDVLGEMVFVDSARWDTATVTKMIGVEYQIYIGDAEYDPVGDSLYDTYDTVKGIHYLPIREAYFKAPITVHDSFYLAGTCFNNIPASVDEPAYEPSYYFTREATLYAGQLSGQCWHYSPIMFYDANTGWYRVYDYDINTQYYLMFPIIRVKDTFSVQVMPNDSLQGTVQGGGAYLENSSVTITAVPAEGYKFVMWNDSVTTNPRTFTLDRDTVFTAYFAEIAQYTVEVASADLSQGSVQGGGTYYETSTATITAVPNEGYQFAMWNDSVTANPRTLVVTQDTAFTAFFEVKVGIAEAEAASELFSISPNPTTKNLQITISQEGSYTMEIYSANGVMLKQESIGNKSTVDVSALVPGSYVIKIYNDTASGIRTFVKQ